jgi:hypothetical protein
MSTVSSSEIEPSNPSAIRSPASTTRSGSASDFHFSMSRAFVLRSSTGSERTGASSLRPRRGRPYQRRYGQDRPTRPYPWRHRHTRPRARRAPHSNRSSPRLALPHGSNRATRQRLRWRRCAFFPRPSPRLRPARSLTRTSAHQTSRNCGAAHPRAGARRLHASTDSFRRIQRT